VTLKTLEPYRADITGIAVESTFNWYWIVDGLMDAGYCVKLVNTAKARLYEGLKHQRRSARRVLARPADAARQSYPPATSIRRRSAPCATCCVYAGASCVNARTHVPHHSKHILATYCDEAAEQDHRGREKSALAAAAKRLTTSSALQPIGPPSRCLRNNTSASSAR